ncbi:MAG TPA: hypothetical protein P5076_11840, partial [Myxococcota bacterium]|nr:hypothetical protein [Myxococcota bacterium]
MDLVAAMLSPKSVAAAEADDSRPIVFWATATKALAATVPAAMAVDMLAHDGPAAFAALPDAVALAPSLCSSP